MQENLIHQLSAPVLFVNGELDKHCRPHVLQEACSGGRLPSHSRAQIVTLPVCRRSRFLPALYAALAACPLLT